MTRLPLFPAGPPSAAVDATHGLRQAPNCSRCDLHQHAIKRCLPPASVRPGTGGLLVVSPQPDRVANATGQVWSDRAHRQALTAITKRWAGPLTLATALGCYSDGKGEAKHTTKCRPYLRSWIDQANPSRIVLLGTLSAWGALGRSVPARSVRRGFTWVQAPSGRIPALMLMDPATLDGAFAVQAWEGDLDWALSASDEFFAQAKQFMERATYEVVESVADAQEACAHLRAWYQRTGRPISWDVETRGKMHNADFRIVSAALCGALDDRAFVWDRRALGAPAVAAELWALLDDPLLHFTEQGSYDERAKLCVTGRGIAGERDDVRLLRKLADCEVKEADLDTLSELVGFGGYKAEFAADLEAAKNGVKPKGKGKATPGVWTPSAPLLFDDCPDPVARAAASAIYAAGGPAADSEAKSYLYALVQPSRLSLYNARDATATGLLREVCFAPIAADPALLALWREVTQPASRSYTVSEHWGVPMSRHAVSALVQYGEAQKAQIAPQLRAHLTPEFSEIDLNSRDQVATFLFTPREMGGLGLSSPKRTERAGKDALDDEAKKALHGAHPFVDLWIAFTSLDAEVEKGQEFQRFLREDGCVHPAILLDGTRTGRPSAREPNVYNMKRPEDCEHCKGKGCEACGQTGADASSQLIRACFSAPSDDFVVCEIDLSQIEVRGIAALSRDPVLTEAYVRKEDVHSFVASHGAKLGVPLTRSDAKPVIFGKGYGQTAIGLANNLKLKRERDESYADYKARKLVVAERVYGVVSQILRGTEHHRAQVIEEARRLGYTFNLWRGVPSQRRPLWEIASSDHRARIHAENAAYSTLIQGSMSGLLVLASHARIVEHITSRGLSDLWRPVVCVYDSIIAVMHKAIVPLATRMTVDVMTSWVIGRLTDGRPFPLEADCKLGRNLAVAKKYKPPASYREALAECQSLGLRKLLTTEQTHRIAPSGAML